VEGHRTVRQSNQVESSSTSQFFRIFKFRPVLTSGVILGSIEPTIRYGKFALLRPGSSRHP